MASTTEPACIITDMGFRGIRCLRHRNARPMVRTAVDENNAAGLKGGAHLLNVLNEDVLLPLLDPDQDLPALVSNFTTEMLAALPTEVPATDARAVFTATPNISLIEPQQRSVPTLAEIGSDQNYPAASPEP
ncbi:hypothetical protein I6F26_00310 [Ensifer sp. IC3342]|nr:hypothetical protein [Ensifer sp. BRP08]MCA1445038.1 hypothetical protein [Ensifer sp. IC3342]